MSGIINQVGARSGIVGESNLAKGTINAGVILDGIDITKAVLWLTGAVTTAVDITVTSSRKYILLMQNPNESDVDGEYPAIAKVSVNSVGVSTVVLGTGAPYNAFGSVLSVANYSANVLRITQGHANYGFNLLMFQVGGS